MSLLDILRATAKSSGPSAKWRARHPMHTGDDARSADWNAWRERQALHPVEKPGPARQPAHAKSLSAAEQRARRLSTRASRRRAQRAASLAQRDGSR